MAIDFATFLAVAPHVLNSRLPVLIRGRHGVGKSEVVYQIAETRELPIVERRASQMTEGDYHVERSRLAGNSMRAACVAVPR